MQQVSLPGLSKKHGIGELQKAFEKAKSLGATNRDKLPDYFSYSALKAFAQGHEKGHPYSLLEYYFQERETKINNSFVVGNIVEAGICGGIQNLEKLYYLYRGRISNKIRLEAEVQKKQPITENTFEKCVAIIKQAEKSGFLTDILNSKGLTTQEKVQGLEPKTGIKLKGFLDLRLDSHIIDIKTTSMISDFENQIYYRFRYWIQAAVYHIITDCDKFTFFVISTQKPHFFKCFTFKKCELKKLKIRLITEVLIPLLQCLEDGFEIEF